MRRSPLIIAGFVLAGLFAQATASGEELQDLYFGEALYYANQDLYFEALARMDTEVRQHSDIDEPELDSLFHHINAAQFSLGDFELRYRMHHRAGRAIRAVLEGAVDELVRNDAAFRLARIHFQKGQFEDATLALERIEGRIPEAIRDDIEFLRANVSLAEGESEAAIEPLKGLQKSKEFGAFAAYNLGIAYLKAGQNARALEQLDRAGQIVTDDEAELAIRDKANLVLGTVLLDREEFASAAESFNRVRLDGPFSNQALLSAGWSNMGTGNIERAVVPWNILADREVTDAATQEAMLALPYAYGQLDVHGRAAIAYGQALDSFGAEIEKLNNSIDSIREGKFLEALVREEIRKDADWVIRLRSLPDAPETYYMMELVASHDFQTGLQNYLDLADLRDKLVAWERDFDAFDDMVAIRREHYEPLLPGIDEEFRALDSRINLRKQQYKMLVKRRDDLLTTPRPEFLATREEQELLARIEAIETAIAEAGIPADESMAQRLARLKGLLTWTLEIEYHERLNTFDTNLKALDEAMAVADEQYHAFVRERQAATHSFEGYTKPVTRLRNYVKNAMTKVDLLMKRQGRLLEIVAVEELVARRGRLERFGDKARFALADSYDRATQAQAMSVEVGTDE
jgi:tetratricopeptide (TPR) repeat protein